MADLRKELQVILDCMIDAMAQAALGACFKEQDREALKHAIEYEERPEEWAERMIRAGQRSEEELIPLPSFEPGAAHLAAALRYQERNIAEGKCMSRPQPLDPRSHRYCSKHLLMARERHTPKRKRVEPGSVAWLYGESLEPAAASVKVYRKHRRIAPAGKALLAQVAKQTGATFQYVRSVFLGDRRGNDRILDAINRELEESMRVER